MKKTFLFNALLAYIAALQAQDVVINEVQASNINTIAVYSNHYDWIELKNTNSAPISLTGWKLSVGTEAADSWVIPARMTIDAKSTLLIFAVGDYNASANDPIHTHFSLASTGGAITLTSPQGTLVDSVGYHNLHNDISFGRLQDGSLSYLSRPTPDAENDVSSAFEYLQTKISISVPSGLYSSPQKVELATAGEGQIHYTLDGSTPTSQSPQYVSAINIAKTTVLKAIVIKSEHEYSIVESRSYIFGAKHSLPVVLLTSDTSYTNLNNKLLINGRVEFCFIDIDGNRAINQYANFEASGKTSNYNPPLNGRVKASKVYGNGNFDYKMFPYKKLDTFESFLLRNASQDWANSYIRDGLASNIIGTDNLLGLVSEGYRPAVLYVNGEYQGITNIKEDDDVHFVKSNFGLDKSEVLIGKTSFFDFTNYDLNLSYRRAEFDKQIDYHEYISLRLLEAYYEENDYRVIYWNDLTGKTPYKTHFCFHDFDTGLGGSENVNFTTINANPLNIDKLIPANIAAYIPYRNDALQYIAAQLNHIYNTERVQGILDKIVADLIEEIPAHAVQMNKLATDQNFRPEQIPYADVAAWSKNIDGIRTNISYRIDDQIFTRLKDKYNLDNTIHIKYETSDSTKGYIEVQDVKVFESSSAGTYFSNLPIRFSAHPKRGYRFVRWEGDVSGSNKDITATFAADASITAVFEAITTLPNNLVINEVQAKNDSTIADEAGEFNDWIELYNPTDAAINLAGYYISDNFQKPLKWQIPATNASKTTINPKGYLLLWADSDAEQGENHLGFKLNPSDQVILTGADGLTTVQYVEFKDVDGENTFAAVPDGSTDFKITSKPTPFASNVYVPRPTLIFESACSSYSFAGKTLTVSGTYTDTLKAVSGADSIVILTLTVNPEYNLQSSKSVPFSQTYQFGTQILDKTGSYTETFKTVSGCDSTVTLAFTVLPEDPKVIEIEETACGEYTFAGKVLTMSGIYKDSLKAVSGADSIVVLTLTINPEYNLQASKSVPLGQFYQFGTQLLDKSGNYTETFQTSNGCDSTVTLAFTVLPEDSKLIEIEETACGEYTFAGKTLSASGIYKDSLKAVSGADSIVVLTLTINPEYNLQAYKSVPFSQTYQFGTQLLNKSGNYTETFLTRSGCDSTITLAFTVLPEDTKLTQIEKTACGEYTFAGNVHTTSGIYKDTLKAISGADSIVVLTLTINPVYNLQATKSAPFGKTYPFGTQLLDKSGNYTETFQSVNGCDSTVTLAFTVLPEDSKLTDISKTACGEYTFAGKTLTTSGIYKDTLKAVSGADSIVVLTLTINPVYNLQATKSVLYGQTYQFGTQKLDKSGSFTEKFQSVNGCDSTITLAFTVAANSAPHITLAVREFSLAENSVNGTAVATITATDSEGAALVYSISGSTAFAIDPATGAVTVKDSSLLDFETNKTVTFTVRVSDGTSYDEAEITVTLTDVVETGLPMNTETVIIFPNTFSDRLSISATAFHGTVLVTAQNGAEVYSAKFGGYTDINTRNWPAGKYTVSIVSGTQVYSETLIKE